MPSAASNDWLPWRNPIVITGPKWKTNSWSLPVGYGIFTSSAPPKNEAHRGSMDCSLSRDNSRGYGGSGLRLRTCMVDSKVWLILAGILLGSMIHWACGKGPVSNDSVPQLLVHPDTLDYGQERTSLSLTISNGGQGPLNWSISIPSEGWVEANQTSGTVLNTRRQSIFASIGKRLRQENSRPFLW